MNDLAKTPVCDRADQLIAFLYGEADEREALEFQSHLSECRSCRVELSSFGQLRESITEWKDETVGRFAMPQLATVVVRKKSAVAALSEFFDLSPLWLKGAVGFATLLFAVMLGWIVFRPAPKPPTVVTSSNQYTPEQVDQIVKQALENQAAAQAKKEETTSTPEVVVAAPIPRAVKRSPFRTARTRPSLSRAEREQLAADLRLLNSDDETSLNLLGDRINQEFQR